MERAESGHGRANRRDLASHDPNRPIDISLRTSAKATRRDTFSLFSGVTQLVGCEAGAIDHLAAT